MNPNKNVNPYESKGYRNYVLILLTLTYSVSFVDRQILAVLLPAIKADMALSDTQLGFLSGLAFAVLYSTIGIPVAKWADRGNRRNILTLAITIWSALTALCGLAQSFSHLILTRVGVSIGEAGGTPPAHSIIADIFDEKSRAMAYGVYGMGIQFGILVGLMLGGWLGQEFGWRFAFIAVGLPGVLIAVLVRLTIKEPPRSESYQAFLKQQDATISETVRWLFSFPSFRHLAAGTALIVVAGYGFNQWAPSFLTRTYDVSLAFAGVSLGLILGIGGAVGTFLGGFLSDRIGAEGDKRWYLWIPGLSALLYTPLAWLFYAQDSVTMSLTLMLAPVALSTTFVGPIISLTQSLAGPNRRAMASGILLLLMTLIGLGLGPQLIGLLSDALNPTFEKDSLKYGMAIVTGLAAIWASFHFFRSAKYVEQDLKRASNSIL